MSTEEERIAKLKSDHEHRLREAERELKALREAERKHKDVAKAAQAAAKAAQDAERAAREEVDAQKEAARAAETAERAAREQAERWKTEAEALRSDQATGGPNISDSALEVTAENSSVLLNVVQDMQRTFERTLQAVVAQVAPTG